jgi:hypothetical protein
MIKCPMCQVLLADDARKCKKCQTDLALLADYVTHLRDGLAQAEQFTKEGELGEAVWAYLSVLEVDPDNTTARRQVGKVATAVRQFDQTAPGRRWLKSLRKETRWQRARADRLGDDGAGFWSWALLFLLYFGSVIGAYFYGFHSAKASADREPPVEAALRARP